MKNKIEVFLTANIVFIVLLLVVILGVIASYWNSDSVILGNVFYWIGGILILALIIANYKKLSRKIKKTLSSIQSASPKPSTVSGPRLQTYVVWGIALLIIFFLAGYVKGCGERISSRPPQQSQQVVVQSRPQVYLQYGKYSFQKGIPYYYIRDRKDLYMYPAVPGTTITLHFQQMNNPSSHWDYKVTRRVDGTIQTGDDQRFNDVDKYGYGIHSVTLVSDENVDIVISGHPLEN